MERWQKGLDAAEVDTPQVVVHQDILQRNIAEMANFARLHGVRLRPHLKTHKTLEIARLQIEAGAVGLTCAKLGEAEVFLQKGFRDLLIAFPLVGRQKMRRLFDLIESYPQATLQTIVDRAAHAAELAEEAVRRGVVLPLWVKIDSGLKRVGVQPGADAVTLVREVLAMDGLALQGVLTHAGHAYGAAGAEQAAEIGRQEATCLLETAELLRQEGVTVPEDFGISVGSTPTVRTSGAVPGVTEIRPGNYVFADATQIRLGAATAETCALRVFSRVVARPEPERLVIDAGAKTLALDKGAHGTDGLTGYGVVVGHPDAVIERLSEEHGVVRVPAACELQPGDLVEIIPNHSCPVANLADELLVIGGHGLVGTWQVAARGKTR
jgi:D-serine deaminase-like pyridoxal phosphate-dependent protein